MKIINDGIVAGWERKNCPSCGESKRIGDQFVEAYQSTPESITGFSLMAFNMEKLGFTLHFDCCNHCGTVYAYKATGVQQAQVA